MGHRGRSGYGQLENSRLTGHLLNLSIDINRQTAVKARHVWWSVNLGSVR